MVDRRRFVTTAAAALVASGIPALSPPEASAGRNRRLRASWWRDRLGASAELQGDHWHLMQIASVEESDAAPELEQFTVLFQGDVGDAVAEGIYRVKVGGARVKLFVQPAGADESAIYAAATVSRLRE